MSAKSEQAIIRLVEEMRMDQGTEKKMYRIITELRCLIEVLKRSCG